MSSQSLYFVYGLAFFSMGLAIAVQIAQPSQLPMAKTLWLLACFGLTHAAAEWGYIFVPLQSGTNQKNLLVLSIVHLSLMALSFAFLLAFGLAQVLHEKRISFIIPAIILFVWIINFIWYYDDQALRLWYIKSEIWERYLLGFPGAVIAGVGLWRREPELKEWGPQITFYLRASAIILLIYSVLSGLIVPAGDVWTSKIINSRLFYKVTGIPVQAVRALSSILLSLFVFRLLSIFRLESQHNIQRVKLLEGVCNERVRIANDIHDGAIQAIYGCGLLLDRTTDLIDVDPARGKQVIHDVNKRLNETINSLRHYIRGLKSDDFGQKITETHLRDVVQQYRDSFPHIVFKEEINIPVWLLLVPGAVEHLSFILQEALANAAIHSGCSQVTVVMDGDDLMFEAKVEDNGRGISEEALRFARMGGLHGNGIKSMKQRSRQLKSRLQFLKLPSGTLLKLKVEKGRFGLG